jgi:hypothetical protein
MTEGGTTQWPELRARGWSREMRRQFPPYQPGKVDTHVFDLVTVGQAEALPEWQAKKAAIVENAARSDQKAAKRAASEEKGRIQAVALARAFEAVEPRLESLLDKVLAEMNATDLAKKTEIARNQLEQAISQCVRETAPNCDEQPITSSPQSARTQA